MSAEAPDRLKEVAERVHDGENETHTLRALLGMFGQARRGAIVNRRIANALASLNLRTEPDFRSVYIDDELDFLSVQTKKVTSGAGDAGGEAEEVNYVGYTEARDGSLYRVRRFLTDAKMERGLQTITRDEPVKTAITMMLADDYSQLPVMQNERTVEGLISWQTIGEAFGLSKKPEYVRDCMGTTDSIVEDQDPIFKLINYVRTNEVALVRNQAKKIVTLFTAADLGDLYKDLSEPFMYLGEIEDCIRAILERGQFTAEELSEYKGGDSEEDIERMDDLTFGGYVRIMQSPENWERIGLSIDRSVFTKRLDEIRVIRNAVMHFDPDGLTPEQVNVLKRFGMFLRTLR